MFGSDASKIAGTARFVVAALAVVSSAAISAPNWTPFASCGDQGRERLYSYDQAAVKNAGGKVAVPLYADYSRVPGSLAQNARITWTVDCTTRFFIEQSRVEYGKRGRVVARYKATQQMNIIPGSVADKLAEKVCA